MSWKTINENARIAGTVLKKKRKKSTSFPWQFSYLVYSEKQEAKTSGEDKMKKLSMTTLWT